MNDQQLIAMGKRCAELNKLAQDLEGKIDDEVVKRLGFKDVKDYENKTGVEFENDVLIDTLHHDFIFDKKTLKSAIGFQKSYLDDSD